MCISPLHREILSPKILQRGKLSFIESNFIITIKIILGEAFKTLSALNM
jgi:hypothetical protein